MSFFPLSTDADTFIRNIHQNDRNIERVEDRQTGPGILLAWKSGDVHVVCNADRPFGMV